MVMIVFDSSMGGSVGEFDGSVAGVGRSVEGTSVGILEVIEAKLLGTVVSSREHFQEQLEVSYCFQLSVVLELALEMHSTPLLPSLVVERREELLLLLEHLMT